MATLQQIVTEKKSAAGMVAAQIGAAFYVMWGILHIYVGILVLSKLLAHGLPVGTDAGRSVMYFWLVILVGVQAILVSIFLNWRNSHAGYWINAWTSIVGDLGLVVFMMIPGRPQFRSRNLRTRAVRTRAGLLHLRPGQRKGHQEAT